MSIEHQHDELNPIDRQLEHSTQASNQTSSVYDLIYEIPISCVPMDEILTKEKPKKPNPMPYINIRDLNNSSDCTHENKPKSAIEIGLSFDF